MSGLLAIMASKSSSSAIGPAEVVGLGGLAASRGAAMIIPDGKITDTPMPSSASSSRSVSARPHTANLLAW